jgi:hypothetical protein
MRRRWLDQFEAISGRCMCSMPALHGPEAHQHPTLMHDHYSESIFLCLLLWESPFEELDDHIRHADTLIRAARFHPSMQVGRNKAIQANGLH